ncbi:hypothetical protein K2173_021426 [Erythroxylum novogranatense]|uniref:Ribosomal protein S15Ab n=1 Tax=Erythroxylum novogranatense TaxID=1862640 RepID=A0AAV8TXK5_9ROSI|nr:hypothetical protein K2173_021426 [Erythroxylum novogranatense]
MYNAEKRGKCQVMIRPSSKVIIKFLLMITVFGKIVVELNGRLNKCGVISPRFDVGIHCLDNFGGIMDHEEARRKNVGGKVLGFFY